VWKLAMQCLETGKTLPAVERTNLTDAQRALLRKAHQTIRKVTQDIDERMHQNTAISAIMELVNESINFASQNFSDPASCAVLRHAVETIVHLLNPFAPHITEELWEIFGHNTMLAREPWPEFSAELVLEDFATIVVQVNGKLRGSLQMARGTAQSGVLEAADADEKIRKHLRNQQIVKIVFVPDKLINIVVKDS
jgi:leucyl-tRNA synthetase